MQKRINWLLLLLLPVLIVIGITGCGKKIEPTTKLRQEPYSDQQFLMGTYVKVQIFDEDKKDILPKVYDRIKELDKKITVNEPGSEVDEINQNAGVKPVKVSEDVFRLIQESVKYSEESSGGFDLTVGPITQLWHIGFDDARKPSQEEIDTALKLVDYHKVKLDEKQQTVYLEKKGMSLDLGAIAKGFITDEAIKVLKTNDVTSAIVDLGGNVYVLGNSPRGKDGTWRVGVQDPNEARNTVVGSVAEKNKSLVTSGIYERNLTVDGKTYHHLFNPKTGYPFENDIAGVTIISDTSIAGDGLSTAIFSMGVKNGLAFVEKRPDIEAIFVTKEDHIYLSKGIRDNFKLNEESHYVIK